MKRTFKNVTKLGVFLLGIFLAITSCQKDDEIIKEEIQTIESTFKEKRIPFDQSEHFGTLKSKLTTLQNKVNNKSSQDRIEDEEILILTDEVLYITYEDTHTYTFKLKRTNPEAYIENIVLRLNTETNDYEEYLVQYIINPEEYVNIHEGGFLENSDNVIITDLENGFFNSSMSKDCGQTCNTVWAACGSGDHHAGNVETWAQCDLTGSGAPSVYTVCVDNYCHQDMSFDESPDGTSGGGGGGTTSTVTNPLETEPCLNTPGDIGITTLDGECLVLTDPKPTPEPDPCEKIKIGTNNAIYKQKFKDLNKPVNFNLPHESGFYEMSVNGQNQYVNGVPNGNAKLNIPNNALNATHVHNNNPKVKPDNTPYDGTVKMLSPGDIGKLMTSIKNANTTTPENGFVIMISNEGIFAITILEDLNLPVDFHSKWRTFQKNYKMRAQFIIEDFTTASSRRDALEKMLLFELKRLGLKDKIGLFEGEAENETDPDINNYNIKWTRKSLKKGFLGIYSVEETPCN